MAKFKRTKPNKPKPETCEALDCDEKPTCVLGGCWFCAKHGSRDYEKITIEKRNPCNDRQAKETPTNQPLGCGLADYPRHKTIGSRPHERKLI